MMKKTLMVSAVTMLFLTGCVTTQGGSPFGQIDDKTATAGMGAAIGCVGGAVLAHLTGGKPLAGCAAGALIGGLVGFEKARQEEIEAAKRAQAEVVSSVAGAKAAPVVTEEVQVNDKNTGETKTVQALKEFSIDMPLSQKGSSEFNQAMNKVNKLAERYADERGIAEVTVAVNPKDAKAQKVTEQTINMKTSSGKGEIIFVKKTDIAVEKGYERITVKARNKGMVNI